MKSLPRAQLQRIEQILRADIRWAAKNMGWNPGRGACWYDDVNKWSSNRFEKTCGTCAIGAHVIRHQPPLVNEEWCGGLFTVVAAAASLKAPVRWVQVVWYGVLDAKADRPNPLKESRSPGERQAQKLAWRLRDYGDSLVAKKSK